MLQERFNNLMLLTIYKEQLDGLRLITIEDEFSDGNYKRRLVLGRFKSQVLQVLCRRCTITFIGIKWY